MTGAADLAKDLSYHLDGLPDRAAYLAAVSACLGRLVGADQVGLAGIDLDSQTMDIWRDPPVGVLERELGERWLREMPIVQHYSAHPDDPHPRRVSDLVPALAWRSYPVYRNLFQFIGMRHQLAIPSRDRTRLHGSGWFLNRAGSDFGDAQVTMAEALRPVLDVLDLIYPRENRPRTDSGLREEARQRAGLTLRELDILTLIAEGLTAQQIATLRRISVRTVGKHLQHVYAKLGCHDRLQAVNRARRLCLL